MKEYQMTIVVEGKKFLPIVKTVLADAVGDMEVDWHASDHSALISAISALLARRRPVLLVLNSEYNDPATGEYARSLAHQGLFEVADREFWEVAIADPNIEAWRVANGREVAELIVSDNSENCKNPRPASCCRLFAASQERSSGGGGVGQR